MGHLVVCALGWLCLAGPAGAGEAAVPVQARPDAAAARRAAELDRALAALAAAPDAAGAAAVEARVRQLWAEAAGPAVTLLLARGVRTLRGETAADSLEDFDAAITLAPDLPDAWHRRAQALALLGDPAAAARDLQQALRLEPRHFPALVALSDLQAAAGDQRAALRSLDAALAVHPRLPGGDERRRDLRRRAEGDDA